MTPQDCRMLLRVCICLGLLAAVLFLTVPALTGEPTVHIHLFWAHHCPHCEREKAFLAKLAQARPEIRLHFYEITASAANQALLTQVAAQLQVQVRGVPVTVVGTRVFSGWLDEATTGAAIRAAVQAELANPGRDVVQELAASAIPPPATTESPVPETITLPLFGEVQTRTVSLPLLAIMLGGVDGFNPCAMWVLIFLIGLLLGLQDRWRMWVLGGVFIGVSAGVYFLFMVAWLNLLKFLGFVSWVRLLIGFIALAAGGYNLKEFFVGGAGVCKVTQSERRQQVLQRLRNITTQQSFWLALGGIILLAFAVNLVELLCSASLPVVFLQVLALNNLPTWQYYFFILLYIFIFMLDDLVVFILAMTTLQVVGLTGKYSRLSNLVGGLLMLTLGLILILKPAWLTFS
jgi:thiol-disulfide isomerase/thioredoxin